jgi:hypothetical protein
MEEKIALPAVARDPNLAAKSDGLTIQKESRLKGQR